MRPTARHFRLVALPGAVEVQRDADELEFAEYLTSGFMFYFLDEAVHRLSRRGKIIAQPPTVESRRHRLKLLGTDIDDARYVADALVVVGAVDRWNELVALVLDVFVILAVLVADICLAIQECDDERVLKPDLERIGASTHHLAERGAT